MQLGEDSRSIDFDEDVGLKLLLLPSAPQVEDLLQRSRHLHQVTRASTLGDSRSQIGRLHPRPTHSRQQPLQIRVLHCGNNSVEVTLQRPFPNARSVTLDPDSRSSASMVV
jgi:hypothetical protein